MPYPTTGAGSPADPYDGTPPPYVPTLGYGYVPAEYVDDEPDFDPDELPVRDPDPVNDYPATGAYKLLCNVVDVVNLIKWWCLGLAFLFLATHFLGKTSAIVMFFVTSALFTIELFAPNIYNERFAQTDEHENPIKAPVTGWLIFKCCLFGGGSLLLALLGMGYFN